MRRAKRVLDSHSLVSPYRSTMGLMGNWNYGPYRIHPSHPGRSEAESRDPGR